MRIPTGELFRATPVVGVETLWKTPVEKPDGPVSLSPVRLDDGTVVVNGKEGTAAFDPDGKPLWRLDLGDCSYRAPVEGPDDVLYVRNGQQVAALQASREGASVLWRKDLPTSAAPVVGPGGELYVAAEDRALHVLDAATGEERSRLEWGHLRSDEPALLSDGRLVLQGYDGHRAIVDPDAPVTGLRRLWKTEEPRVERVLREQTLKPSGIGPDGAEYRIEGRSLQVLEPDGRTVRWTHDLGSDDLSVHVTVRQDGSVYAQSGDHTLTALSPDGQPLWTWRPDGAVRAGLTLDDQGNAYLLGSGPNWKAYSVDAQGRQRWATALPGPSDTARVGPKSTLLVSGAMSPLSVLDSATGALIHHTEEGAAFGDQPFVALSDGTMVLATEDGDLLGLRLRTPELVRDRLLAADPGPAAPEIREAESFVVIGGVSLPLRA